ncbi:MAG: phosphomannomutase/phosphoglucomutase [Patescibacteria group bacterium]|nr:phosphomannomutase/phosphoglucomutase [Patescibacteria group bacterium]
MNTKIFKAYDIRGIYPSEINEDIAYKVGRAIVVFTKAKKIAVGRDMRVSSPELFDALARGITAQGADVVDIGMCTTPMLDFATANYEENDAGIMITASHNPKEYGGLKLFNSDVSSIGGGSGMEEIRDMVLRNNFSNAICGKIEKFDVLEPYIKKIYEIVDIKKIADLKIAIDVGNGMAGIPLKRIFKDLPCKIIPLYLDPDGDFPNHQPNPSEEKNLKDLKKAVIKNRCDLGIAFDGDGDRCKFIDEKGNPLRGDITTIILAKKLLKENPGRTIVYDIISSWSVPEEVEKAGGRAVVSRVGHSFMKATMKKENAILGGEMSGHFYYGSFFSAESSMLTMLMFLVEMSVETLHVTSLQSQYHHTGEINFEVADKEAKIQQVEEKYSEGAKDISHLDGVKIEFEDWWLSVRPSNTEPFLRLNLEAKTKELMEEKRDEISKLLSV